jgi:ribonuclease T1
MNNNSWRIWTLAPPLAKSASTGVAAVSPWSKGWSMGRPYRLFFALLVCLASWLLAPTVAAFDGSKIGTIDVRALPKEGRETLALIRAGGPFPYAKDGTVFGNREARLPKQKRGYYREYTVKTPGARNRGARRIVCGAAKECFYTADHYETFKLIRE